MAELRDQEFKLEPKFSYHELRGLSPKMRAARVQELTQILSSYFERVGTQSVGNIFETGYDKTIIQALRDAGHDLWSWGYDGGSEVWGADYVKQGKDAFLKIEIHGDWTVNCEWVASPEIENK